MALYSQGRRKWADAEFWEMGSYPSTPHLVIWSFFFSVSSADHENLPPSAQKATHVSVCSHTSLFGGWIHG